MPIDFGSLTTTAKKPTLDFSSVGGMRGLSSPSVNFLAPEASFEKLAPKSGGTDWLQLLGVLASGGLGLGSMFGYGKAGTELDYNPSLTADSAKSMIASQGVQAYGNINRQASQAKKTVSSNFIAHGLGSSGAQIGDIAGVDTGAMSAYGDVQSQLMGQLAQMLEGIDQRDLQVALSQQASKKDTWGTIGDLALTLGSFLL
jgi:hypothetical protein